MLNTENVNLRQVMDKDFNHFLTWYNNPEIQKNITLYLPISEQEEKDWINRIVRERKKTDIFFVIDFKIGNKIETIGSCGVHKINHKDRNAEISCIIGDIRYRNKGLGTKVFKLLLDYCFKELNLYRVYSGSFEFNIPSQKSLIKAGLTKEGVLRKAVFKNGTYHDIILFSILKEEW